MNALLIAALFVAADPTPAGPRKLTADDCVREALKESGQVLEAEGKVQEWKGKLLEVESVYWPKLQGLGYVAPLYGLKEVPGSPYFASPLRNGSDLVSDWSRWGPYTHLELILAQPLYTFGRQPAGEKAALNRLEVEKARYAATRNTVALEVRRYYLLTLYARSIQPALNQAKSILDDAEKSAKELYAEGQGGATQVDLMKLRYGLTELGKFRIRAQIGAELGLAALKHTMGLRQDAQLELADEALPPLPEAPLAPLAELIARAALNRPETAQLKFGEEAAKWFAESEKLSSMPTVFIAGQLELNWAPGRPVSTDPYAFDRFNIITPGVAIGMQFDVDPRKSWAKYQGAKGLVGQVEGLKRFAGTGIAMEVRKAYDDAVQADQLTRLSNEGSAAGRKWLVFAGTAYAAGTGEAKDLLEGLVVYLQARQSYFENLQLSHFARATILYATGETGVE